MNPTRPTPIPEVFVLWHPACRLGEDLARRLYAWLRPGNGLGPQVFYRCLKAPEAPAGGLPPPLPGESRAPVESATPRPRVTNVQIILPLIARSLLKQLTEALCRFMLAGRQAIQSETVAGNDEADALPKLVVEALEGARQTAGIPELGNSPCIRWDDTVKDQEEQVVTTLLRDVMLAAFHSFEETLA